MRRLCIVFATLILVTALFLAGCGSQEKNQSTPKSPVSTKKLPANAEEVVKALKESGLPIGKVMVFTAENDPNSLLGRPGQYTSKVNFVDTRINEPVSDKDISVENGGSVEFFANKEDAKKRYEYVSAIAKSGPPMFVEYDYLVDKVLLRVSGKLTPQQAAEYEAKLKEIMMK
ncbi:MAG: hypothetical protein PWQ91_410 [Eubacteriales bacterium]|nr:hypothetical protein [Eubacteriales bacterium]MDN5363349.1 hypothetical protein [Eubacteriales bacterium]